MTSVLVVDDDRSLATLIADVLQDEGYTVDLAHSAQEAAHHIQYNTPDVMTLDLTLESGMNGDQLLALLREIDDLPAIRIVVVSGDSQAGKRVAHLGADRVLTKPFSVDELLDAVQAPPGLLKRLRSVFTEK